MCLLLGMGIMNAYSQTLIDGNKFFDNWSVGVSGGGLTPFSHGNFLKDMRPVVGLELSKQVTPGFGLGVEGMAISTYLTARRLLTVRMSACWVNSI